MVELTWKEPGSLNAQVEQNCSAPLDDSRQHHHIRHTDTILFFKPLMTVFLLTPLSPTPTEHGMRCKREEISFAHRKNI